LVVKKETNEFEETIYCPICNSQDYIIHDYKDNIWNFLSTFRNLKIKACKGCGFGYSFPELADSEVNVFYEKHYRAKNSPFHTDFKAIVKTKHFDTRSISQLLLFKQFFNIGDKPVFLDIGPGKGQSFSSATKLFTNPTCVAIEHNEGAAEALERVYSAFTFNSLKDFNSAGKKADFILMSHSLEHFKLSWLGLFFKEIKQAISPVGGILIEVPQVDMRLHHDLRVLDAPHFLFFSKTSLRKLFENNGWDVIFCESCGEIYETLIEGHVGQIKKENFLVQATKIFKTICLKLYRALPSKIRSIIYFTKNNYLTSGFQIDNNFNYCGDRTIIRLVARPKNHLP